MAVRRKQHWSAKLTELGACYDAVAWCRRQPSLLQAWRLCKHTGWMMWLLTYTDSWKGKEMIFKDRQYDIWGGDIEELRVLGYSCDLQDRRKYRKIVQKRSTCELDMMHKMFPRPPKLSK